MRDYSIIYNILKTMISLKDEDIFRKIHDKLLVLIYIYHEEDYLRKYNKIKKIFQMPDIRFNTQYDIYGFNTAISLFVYKNKEDIKNAFIYIAPTDNGYTLWGKILSIISCAKSKKKLKSANSLETLTFDSQMGYKVNKAKLMNVMLEILIEQKKDMDCLKYSIAELRYELLNQKKAIYKQNESLEAQKNFMENESKLQSKHKKFVYFNSIEDNQNTEKLLTSELLTKKSSEINFETYDIYSKYESNDLMNEHESENKSVINYDIQEKISFQPKLVLINFIKNIESYSSNIINSSLLNDILSLFYDFSNMFRSVNLTVKSLHDQLLYISIISGNLIMFGKNSLVDERDVEIYVNEILHEYMDIQRDTANVYKIHNPWEGEELNIAAISI